jgi:hypothetical protein
MSSALLEDREVEGGACPLCAKEARLLTCWECCESAWTIDCEHRVARREMRWGRINGSESHRVFCVDCADVLSD